MQRILALLFLAWAPFASAGYIEIGATGNYRISTLDKNNYQELLSYTGSVAYYFWELSALELSYTEGTQIVVIKAPSDTSRTTTTTTFQLSGLDLVLTLADKQSAFQPYVKLGGAYIVKKMIRRVEGIGQDEIPGSHGLVPSAGLGFKFRLTQNLSLKAGVDAWSSPPDQATVIDYAGRAGISWMF